ncbi:hypothetical protein [Halorubellus litoreus]|uniref:Uncharacterized protein n=1 Tax=Halorubellus litoreus TaxID=755308 RepID=A0ABD5VH06_9EURY
MEFHNLSFETAIDEMDEDELRATLTEFAEKHEANQAAFNDLVEALDGVGNDGKEAEFEALQEEVSAFKAQFAEALAERVPLTVEELAEFSLSRLYEMDEQTEEAPADLPADDDPVDDPADDDTPSFMKESKPSKAGDFSADDYDSAVEKARGSLQGIPGLSFD